VGVCYLISPAAVRFLLALPSCFYFVCCRALILRGPVLASTDACFVVDTHASAVSNPPARFSSYLSPFENEVPVWWPSVDTVLQRSALGAASSLRQN